MILWFVDRFRKISGGMICWFCWNMTIVGYSAILYNLIIEVTRETLEIVLFVREHSARYWANDQDKETTQLFRLIVHKD